MESKVSFKLPTIISKNLKPAIYNLILTNHLNPLCENVPTR